MLSALFIQPANAQNNAVAEYLSEAGNYAALYRGVVEPLYNTTLCKTLPYHISPDFTDAEVCFNHKEYTGRKMRYDTNKDHFLVMTPSNHSIILDSRKVQWVKLHGRKVINHTPPANAKFKAGFYFLFHNGKQLTLLGKERQIYRELPSKIEYTFDTSMRYYALYNGEYYPVKNKKSFTRLLPKYKKQIARFCKTNRLDFRENREYSLTTLGAFCDELLNNQTL